MCDNLAQKQALLNRGAVIKNAKNDFRKKQIFNNIMSKIIFQTSLGLVLIGASLLSFSAKSMDLSEVKKEPLQVRRISYSSAKKMYESCDKKEKGRESLYFLCKNNEVYSQHAAVTLFQSDHIEDKMVGRQTLQSYAKEKNMSGVRAATTLFQDGNIKCRNFSRKILYSIIRNPEEYYKASGKGVYTDHLALQLDTATILITKGNKKDKQVGEKALVDAYNNTKYLSKSKCLRSLGMIAFTLESSHPIAFYALRELLDYDNCTARSGLLHISQMEGNPHQYKAAKLLYKKNDPEYAEVLRSIASQKNNPNQKEASEELSMLPSDFSMYFSAIFLMILCCLNFG